MKQNLEALCGAPAGGNLGNFAFFWIARQRFYAQALPGGLVGMGAGTAKTRSILVPVLCALAAARWVWSPNGAVLPASTRTVSAISWLICTR